MVTTSIIVIGGVFKMRCDVATGASGQCQFPPANEVATLDIRPSTYLLLGEQGHKGLGKFSNNSTDYGIEPLTSRLREPLRH